MNNHSAAAKKAWKKRRRHNKSGTKSKVVAHLPTAVELTRRTTQNSLRVTVKIANSMEGTLNIGQGTIEWWPDHNKVNAYRCNWERFAEMMESLPVKRSSRN